MFIHKKGLIKERFNNWKGKGWYHQRFDGVPYFMSFVCDAEILFDQELKFGADFTVHYCFYDTGKADWYIAQQDIEKVCKAVFDKSEENLNLSNELITKWKKFKDKFYKKIEEIKNTDLTKLSNESLQKLHNESAEIFCSAISCSSIIDGFALGTDELLSERLKEKFDKSELKNKMRFTEFFTAVTSPLHLSFINQAELELLKIAVQKNIEDDKKEELLKEIQKEFFWINNNYVNPIVLSLDHFAKELEKLQNSNIDLEKELKKIQTLTQKNEKKQKDLLDAINADDNLKFFVNFTNDLTAWQDERKKNLLLEVHYFNLFLKEFSSRLNIEHELLKYIIIEEAMNIFDFPPNPEELKLRMKSSAYYWDKIGYDIDSGNHIEKMRKELIGEKDIDKIDDFRGLTACAGKVIGKVKVVRSVKEINKVEKGDILVAVMTRPDYIPAIRKAAAIVTDEGGITCHAAIIAREIGIPCIIGTKIATKTLKDNDYVEVNANHGWIRLLKGKD